MGAHRRGMSTNCRSAAARSRTSQIVCSRRYAVTPSPSSSANGSASDGSPAIEACLESASCAETSRGPAVQLSWTAKRIIGHRRHPAELVISHRSVSENVIRDDPQPVSISNAPASGPSAPTGTQNPDHLAVGPLGLAATLPPNTDCTASGRTVVVITAAACVSVGGVKWRRSSRW